VIFADKQILERLAALEQQLTRIESAVASLRHADDLRAELDAKKEQMDELSQQSLHIVELLAQARRELAAATKGE